MSAPSKLLLVIALFLAALAATGTAPGQVVPRPDRTSKFAKIGEKAPDFKLVDTNGRERRLADYPDKIVVLEWTNPDCPFVQRLYKTRAMQETHRKLKAMESSIVWLAINSTYPTTAARNNFWINDNKLEYPILLDTDGTVGRLYDARRTPHMFVIDAKGILRYHGAIDDNKLGSSPPEQATNYVVRAVEQILDDAGVAPDNVPEYGCTIKYRRR